MGVRELIQRWDIASGLHLTGVEARQLLQEAGIRVVEQDEVMRPGVELRIVVEQDPMFGPVIAFSYGRMAMEVWEDVAYRILPITEKDAHLMVREPKGQRLLQGYGVLDAPNASLIETTLLKLSEMVGQAPEVVGIELDPIFAYSDDLVVQNASIELRSEKVPS